jgi:prepilin peptidase CpaA
MFTRYVSELMLITAAAVLFDVARNDLQHYKIQNGSILVLIGLFFVHALLSGRWTDAHWNIVFALLMFLVMFVIYSFNLIGGGDVKLLSVAFLWVGIDCALAFALLLLLFSGIHAIASKLGWADVRVVENDDRKRIPFAPSIAAAVTVVFMLGCLGPMP